MRNNVIAVSPSFLCSQKLLFFQVSRISFSQFGKMNEANTISDSSDDEGVDRYVPSVRITHEKWEPDKLDRYYISRTNPPAKFVLPFSKLYKKPPGIPDDLHEEHEIYDTKFDPNFELSTDIETDNLRFWKDYPKWRPSIKPVLKRGYRLREGRMCGKKFGERDVPYKSVVMAHWIYRNRAWVLIQVRYPVKGFVLKEWQPLSVALESDVASDVVHYVFRLGLIYRDKKWWKVSEKFDTLRTSKWMDDMEEEERGLDTAEDGMMIKKEDC